MKHLTPYRVVAFFDRPARRGKPQGYAIICWNPVQHYREARLPSAGSFLWPGLAAAKQEAGRQLSLGAYQIAIKTDQDQDVARYYRRSLRYPGPNLNIRKISIAEKAA